MVARIKIGSSIKGALKYNENKVEKGTASLILASGFAGEISKMDFFKKLKRFSHLIELKPSVKTNSVHISLNFHSSEELSVAKMQQIAIEYMDKIGFGEQPYLVYRHDDAAHPHFHILTTSIQKEGTSIPLHNIARNKSEPARKQLEIDFGFVVAQNLKYTAGIAIKPINAEQIIYGKISTKRAISNVLSAVINSYHYTTLNQLNVVLKCFNVIADRGNEQSDMFKSNGLIFWVLDSQGNKVGVPIKASSFYGKPTLQNLERKFEKNKLKPKIDKLLTLKKIERVWDKFEKISKSTLLLELKKQGIDLVLHENKAGLIYGTTYVDHANKISYKGSELGKAFTASAITAKFASKDLIRTYLRPIAKFSHVSTQSKTSFLSSNLPTQFLDNLLAQNEQPQPIGIAKPKRKRKQAFKR